MTGRADDEAAVNRAWFLALVASIVAAVVALALAAHVLAPVVWP